MSPGKLWIVAVLLLTLALVDLFVPGVCKSDGPTLNNASRSSASLNANEPVLPHGEDGCFCCCTHIVPAPHVELVAGLTEQSKIVSLAERGPEVFLSIPHHPPRS